MKTKLVAILLLAGSSLFGVGPVVVAAPPPPVVAYAPPYARPGYTWVGGYWYPAGPSYAWRAGNWARPPYAGGY